MLKHDCVIVPGLGGFVTQYVSARRVDDEQLFLPPYRSVGFNPQLTLNDGLLVQSYMQAYDTTYPETVKLIADAVAQLKKQLQQDGEYELRGIGTLSMDVSGRYDFAPCEAGVISPELYGLDSVMVAPLAEREAAADNKVSALKPNKKKVNVKRTEREYTISINRELVNYVAAAIVAVVFYFLWATPVNNSAGVDKQTASVVYEQLFDKAAQKVANAQAAIPVSSSATNEAPAQNTDSLQTQAAAAEPLSIQRPTEQPLTLMEGAEQSQETAQAEENTAQPIAANTATQETKGAYTLVLASAISESNATAYAQNLKREGLPDASPYKRGRMVRVVYGHYSTEGEAQQALSRLRRHKAFAEAWVMQTK